ncbi:hypothetical protein D0867_12239 [Hortaea werneckii]|uniref:RNA helicase n=1 Tax=Hortaea werneckii TaxID=91943 RepID=A0A3M6Y7S0_HORWE|nr:hypothetical protein D0867_12239 [Hortaea werneckii]RMY19841.1 hypothetical protein D0866_12696 [Hortaea werneckii]
MLRYPFVCPPCEARAISRILPPWTGASSSRPASTLQNRRQPSRMTLSPNVARGPPKSREGDLGKSRPAARRSRNTPFGGMNITEPPRSFQDSRQGGYKGRISAAEQRRASRHVKSAQKSRGDGKDSRDPMKALKMQRALANVSYERRGRVKQELAERDSFDQFDLLPIIKESISRQALGGMTDVSPTPIQRLAIPALLGTEEGKRRRKRKELIPDGGKKEMQQFLLAAETGSGKTLAYILPIIDAIKRAEKAEQEQERTQAAQQERQQNRAFEIEAPDVDEPHPSTGRPRAIILLPTSELVAQVGALVKSLSHTVKFRSALISSSYTATVIRSRLFSPGGIDIVISTPHLLSSITESDPNVLSRVTHLVIDEADSLLDRSFSPTTSAIVDRATPSLQQLVLCSATIPRSLDSYVHKRFPAARRLVTPNLHAIPRRVQLSVVDIDKVPYQGNRDLACAQTIWDIGKEAIEHGEERAGSTPAAGANGRKIVVFVNEREKTVELASYLQSKGIDAVALSRDSDERRQAEILAEFTGMPTPTASPTTTSRGSSPRSPPRGRLAGTKVLVMTDLGSRGIDTLAVKHVVLYDVPHTSIDFIHRLGRVGRMGRRGRGVVLVGRHDRRDVVKEVREGMFRGQALI